MPSLNLQLKNKQMSKEVVRGNFFHNTSEKFAHNFYNKYLSKGELQRPLKVRSYF